MHSIDDLPGDLRRSFMAGYDIDEMTMHGLDEDRRRGIAATLPMPDAYEDGYRLRKEIVFVYSSDTSRELRRTNAVTTGSLQS